MVYNDLTFFTNEPERDLYSRFNTILRNNTQFFDVLVGYFRTSGFFKLYPAMSNTEKIRVLVGLNVDAKTFEIIHQSHRETKNSFGEEVEKEFNESEDSQSVEQGVRIFIDWLKSGKIEMRVYPDAPIHAKIYIMRKDIDKNPEHFGSVITGSSNFSYAGLVNNLEFNVELKDSRDVKFALEKFEELWAKSVDISEVYIDVAEKNTWLRNDITPYKLYLKTLYEYFKEEINTDKETILDEILPDSFMRLQYQFDAVVEAEIDRMVYELYGLTDEEIKIVEGAMQVTLQEILNATEGHHFEFKEAKNRQDIKEATQYLCAMANHGGGRLVLGVTDKRPRKIVGSNACPQPESTVRHFMDKLRVRVDFQLYEDEKGKRVLVFEVASRPVGLPVQFEGIAWWRDGDSLVPMPENVRRTIYAEGGNDFTAEVCKGITIDDLDSTAIEVFRNKWLDYSENKRLATLSTEQLLRDASVVNDDGITYAALILYGKRAPLLKHLSTAEVCYEYRLTEASGPAGAREDFRTGFFNYFDRIWELVNQRNENQHYQKRFQMLPVITFNEVVVREALLNAVSHRDYQLKGSIFVRQYGRKIVIESPGGFPPGITTENILGRHQARNGLIAAVFQLCGLVERSGQGMNLIYERAVREAKPLPSFTGSDSMFVRLTLDCKVISPKMLALLKEIGEERLDVMTTEDYLLLGALYRAEDMHGVDPAKFNHLEELGIVKYCEYGVSPKNGGPIPVIGSLSEVTSDKLPITTSDKQHQVLEYMAKHDYVTTAMLAELLGITQRAALDILKKLEENGFVVRSGKNRNSKYALKK